MGYTAMGDYDGVPDDPVIENKTSNPKQSASGNEKSPDSADTKYLKESQQIVDQTGEKNILNNYRSVTYQFTLAALKKDYLKDPQKLRESELELVILKSGGKGTNGISSDQFNNTAIADLAPQTVSQGGGRGSAEFASRDPRRLDLPPEKKDSVGTNFGQQLLNDFNTKSPGRFDFFIENIDIDSIMSFSKDSNLSMPTKIRFEVVEPYSMNGLIEALYVTSLAAGYSNYLHAAFVLKIEFWGYPDNDTEEFLDPVKIPNSERYFPIGLTNIEVDITERGTRYKVEAVPYNERAFGQPNTVKKAIKMQGTTVKEILENFMKNLNEQVINEFKESHKDANINQVDTYEIKFPSWSEQGAWVYTPENAISSQPLVELMKDNALYGLVDPASTDKPNAYKANGSKQPSAQDQAKKPESIKYNPSKTVVQFAEGMNVHDVISAVARDSEYVRNILKDIKKHTDQYGMVDYFMIRIETNNTDIINPDTKKPAQKFTYILSPFKIHYSKIPNLADNLIDEKELRKLSRREYNYIYTGQNIDVINFKLNFNNLFFEAVPAAMGNKDAPEAKTAAGNNNNVKTGQKSPEPEVASKMQVPLHPKKVVTTQMQNYGGNASQPLDDPYSVLARNMHNAVVNSKSSMVTGEIEILGDPFYLVEGGIGNYNPKPVKPGILVGGQAAHTQQQTMITINFRNPIDIMPAENGGTMYFDANRIPFSGVYMVTEVHHSFKDGAFKQRIEIVRVPGQILDYNLKATDPSQSIITSPEPQSMVKEDNTRAISYEQRADSDTLSLQLGRGSPDPLNNFTGATGGLGGQDPTAFSRNFGLVGRNGGLFTGASVVGAPLPTDLTSNIRLNASGLAALGKTNLSTAALLAVATNVLTGNIPAKRAVGVVAGAVAGSAISSALKLSNPGSGIGEGASVLLNKPSIDLSETAIGAKFQSAFNSARLPTSSVSDISNTLSSLRTTAVDAVENAKKQAGDLVNNFKNKVDSLTTLPADPAAVAAQVGINASALSGLDTKLTSKIPGQLTDLIKQKPADVNLSQAVDTGLVLDYIPSGKIANIPATMPFSIAPAAATSLVIAATARATGLISNVASSSLKQLNTVDASVYKDKLSTAVSQVDNLVNRVSVIDRNITGSVTEKFGSTSASLSPLDKLINRTQNSNNA